MLYINSDLLRRKKMNPSMLRNNFADILHRQPNTGLFLRGTMQVRAAFTTTMK